MENMIQYAKRLLKLQYEQCADIVQNDEFYRGYALEKWRHSWQVFGAGNYLMKRIEWLQQKPPAYINMVKTAVLLHDCCRFTEIVQRYSKQKPCDHSVAGAEFLRNTPMFQDIRIWLPIKHHGHVIEELYEDTEYQNIENAELKKEVEQICFLVRDADKIANLHLIKNEPNILPLFLGKSDFVAETDGIVSAKIKARPFAETTLPRSYDSTVAERIAGYLSWFMDINYKASIEYCERLEIIETIFTMLDQYCIDVEFKQSFAAFVRNFLQRHEFLR